MEPKVAGTRALLEVKARHWIVDGAHRLNCGVIATPVPSRKPQYSCLVRSVFLGVNEERAVRHFMRSVRGCRLDALAHSDAGLLAIVECKGRRTLECRASRLRGRVGMFASPKHASVRITVDSPVPMKPRQLVAAFRGLPGAEIEGEPEVEDAKIPLTDFVEIEPSPMDVDEKDKLIASELLNSGYYETPRPEGLTLKSLERKVDLTKPALIRHIRRLESLGIRKILGLEELTEEDRKAAYKAAQAAFEK